MSAVEIFELFFSEDLKKYIIEATRENGLELSYEDLNKFVGILIASIVNVRKKEGDFWSRRKVLHHKLIADTLSRKEFLVIKRHLKLSKKSDQNLNNKIWRVHNVIEILKKNLQQFGFFSSKYSVDESMIKFFGRCRFKQYMRNKPIKFGLKLWALCSISGYLFDFNIYCGKDDNFYCEKLKNCTLGTRVVMTMLHMLLQEVSKERLKNYHVCFDNFFSSPDLIVHLKDLGLKSTGTVRQNRIYEKVIENEKEKRVTVSVSLKNNSPRGSFECKHDSSSKINYVSVKDSKIVSILSSAAGVTPTANMERYSAADHKKVQIAFPQAFQIYNKCMYGVDLHDQHCNDVKIEMKSKKWTWSVFLRIIEISISNATVLYNLCSQKNKKSTYSFVLDISEAYLEDKEKKKLQSHKLITIPDIKRKCSKCAKKTITCCFHCYEHMCKNCFEDYHGFSHKSESQTTKRKCSNRDCEVWTQKYCTGCSKHICKKCYDGSYHKKLKLP